LQKKQLHPDQFHLWFSNTASRIRH
jgi:hypothetical protein